MADTRIAWSEIECIICMETGLKKEELVSKFVKNINPSLVTALELSRNHRDPNPFLNEWREVQYNKTTSERNMAIVADKFATLHNKVESEISNVFQVKLEGEDFYSGFTVKKICDGWKTYGTYDGVGYSYYTRDSKLGVEALINFITQQLVDDDITKDLIFDEFLDDTLLSGEDLYDFKSKRGTQEWIKETVNG